MAIFRDPIALSLQSAGYTALKAADGKAALAVIRAKRPDLVLLDLAMPELDGMSVLTEMRADPALATIPVIMLTALSDKVQVLQAASLGVRDYLLKSQFSLQDLLQRVKKHLTKPAAAAPTPAPTPVAETRVAPCATPKARIELRPAAAPSPSDGPHAPRHTQNPSHMTAADVHVPRLLTRDEALARAERTMQGKTLSGVVAQVITLATSPRTDTSQLAEVISRDPILAARVLQVANTAAYASSRGVVSTISDAIRNVGCNTIRNIAAAVGVFDAMPASDGAGFNPIRCWQHSFAVAQLCERIAPPREGHDGGLAYLVGLCHDLGEILFHTQFASEYQHVVELHAQTGRARPALERQVLGVTRGELITTIFRGMELPENVRRPVEAFHDPSASSALRDPLARVLLLAEWYANGALLASSPEAAAVSPVPKAIAKTILGDSDPPSPDPVQLRSEVYTLTAMLGRLSRAAEAELTTPLYRRTNVRVWVARDPALSSFDPVTAAVSSLAHHVDVQDRLPTPEEAARVAGIVVVARTAAVAGFTSIEIEAARNASAGSLPVLWLVGTADSPANDGDLRPVRYPAPLDTIAGFVSALASPAAARAA